MLAAVLGASLALSIAAQREPVDAVAAVIERRVVTTSEVQAEARLVLLERAGPDVATGSLDAGLLQKVLDAIVVQELLALEARRTGIAVREVDIDKSVETVRARFSDSAFVPGAAPTAAPVDASRAFFAKLGVDEELLRGRARRDLAAGALLNKMFADVKVTDAEATALLSSRPELVDVASARTALEKERKEQKFAALVDTIRRSTEVRVVWRP
jgi:hypothetical protein